MVSLLKIIFRNNIFVNVENIGVVDAHGWKHDSNFVTEEEPGFVDIKNMNFQLKEDSIVFKKIPGFERITFKNIGINKGNITAVD